VQKEIFIDNLGRVILRQSNRSRYLRLRVDIKEGIVATAPVGLPDKFLIKFLEDKKAWLKKALQKQDKIRNQITLFTHGSVYQTRNHTLYLRTHRKKTIKTVVGGQKIITWYPEDADVTDERIQTAIRKAVIEAWRVEAKLILPRRVGQLAEQFNFRYKKLAIKNAKTRWGSCSAENNINLNLQLMRLPDELINYVILHELMHTVHKHHQSSFWKALEQIMPGARNLDKALNDYHLEYW
jgi:predicted metal-dependent hydrolase